MSRSHVRGATSPPLLPHTIGRQLDLTAQRWGDGLALVSRHEAIRWTYAELRTRVDRCAAALLALGLVPGDRVGIWSPNHAAWLLAQLATARAGLILVTINPAYRSDELAYALDKVGCRAVLTVARTRHADHAAMLRELGLPGASARVPSVEFVIALDAPIDGALQFADLVAAGGDAEMLRRAARNVDPDDPVCIQFTSGTTGRPKGATLSHRNILNNGYFVGEALRLDENDRLCIPVPLYHCFGMVMGNLGCLTHGATMVYPDASFDAASVLHAVVEERCTALYGVPTMFIAMLAALDGHDVTSLRTGIMAGSPCPVEIMRQVVSRLHLPEITIAYGMTETSPVSFQSAVDDTLERRVTTVGRVQPHIEARIVDADGRTVPIGASGELLTRGYCVMRGYWGDADQTGMAIDEEGWMHTGDLATFDEDGFCNIVGRSKDMIIRGGENIYPREIEGFLHQHPALLDVQVVGVPDAKYGEVPCAWVRLRDGMTADEDEIRAFCAARIAHFKVPRYVRIVDAFPLTATGKVQKFRIREAMIEELRLVVDDTA